MNGVRLIKRNRKFKKKRQTTKSLISPKCQRHYIKIKVIPDKANTDLISARAP